MESLGLDVKILLAQIINFGLLLFILSKVLYKPVIKLIDERNKKLTKAIEDSAAIEKKLEKIEESKKDLLSQARQNANKEREDLIKMAQEESRVIIDNAKKKAEKEIEKGLTMLKTAKVEAEKELTDKFMERVMDNLLKKLSLQSKKNDFPLLRKTLK
ncbi:hypothetical protein A2714_04035 [Candidatus Woesebacteria bacterium RIFCSPHIGHO2_01_FULL_38_9]|uniref:ATP synthase subunit b n=2 Tax=Candidatus Woeseibacteriota TaxID=1752722 RepID=A0A1F7XZR5_9BACT|nr:MAG: hypothetical protein A2714_04035 [Candidatus Woesebacteria bacterium RIFCSPHIGHO2_01_FULL_38_9]OGM60080.1 MAG: hypothetical protein A3A75_01600 [Candidatus Woesebacteria bacterium RIFCSPLOWO2_01_FULL_39_10]